MHVTCRERELGLYTQLWDRELNCAHSYGTEGTEIVHVTGQTEGTGIVYTAMG